MESKWVISFEDIVYLILSGGLVCLIITWMFTGLLVSKESYDLEPLTSPSNSLISESIPQIEIENHSPPIESQRSPHALNIHPLKVVRIHSKKNTSPR